LLPLLFFFELERANPKNDWKSFHIGQVKLLQSNFVFHKPFSTPTFETSFWKAHFGFCKDILGRLKQKFSLQGFYKSVANHF
jgi:hypothetical protein